MIYVDDMKMKARVGEISGHWSHLFSDVSIQELDEFAEKLDLKPGWLQCSRGFWHYDVTDNKRHEAIRLGAKPISWQDLTTYWIYEASSGTYKFKHPPT